MIAAAMTISRTSGGASKCAFSPSNLNARVHRTQSVDVCEQAALRNALIVRICGKSSDYLFLFAYVINTETSTQTHANDVYNSFRQFILLA